MYKTKKQKNNQKYKYVNLLNCWYFNISFGFTGVYYQVLYKLQSPTHSPDFFLDWKVIKEIKWSDKQTDT